MNEQVAKLLEQLSGRSTNWPMLIRKYNFQDKPTHVYPKDAFDNLYFDLKLGWSNLAAPDRRAILKELIDLYADHKIDIATYHFGHYCIYLGYMATLSQYEKDFTESTLGRRRYAIYESIPSAEYVTNDVFVASLWTSLQKYYDSGDTRNPNFSKVRLMFEPELFGYHCGPTYYDCEWVEPRPNRYGKEVWLHKGGSRQPAS